MCLLVSSKNDGVQFITGCVISRYITRQRTQHGDPDPPLTGVDSWLLTLCAKLFDRCATLFCNFLALRWQNFQRADIPSATSLGLMTIFGAYICFVICFVTVQASRQPRDSVFMSVGIFRFLTEVIFVVLFGVVDFSETGENWCCDTVLLHDLTLFMFAPGHRLKTASSPRKWTWPRHNTVVLTSHSYIFFTCSPVH